MANIWFLKHLRSGGLGLLGEVLAKQGHTVSAHLPKYDALPATPPPECHGIVILGGPMSLHERERNPWLAAEEGFVRAAVEADLPVLGVCLGAQLLASAMGMAVYPLEHQAQQFGWHTVSLTPEGLADPVTAALLDNPQVDNPQDTPTSESLRVFEWHGDGFDLPPEAILLAHSPIHAHQAYRLGAHGYGFHFHFELDAETITTWVDRSDDFLRNLGLEPQAILAALDEKLPPLRKRGARVASAFGELVQAAAD